MRVFLTGATGFVGSYILRELVAQGHTARCLVRNPEAALAVAGAQVEKVKGDILKPKSFLGTMRGCDAVIHLVGIIEEQPDTGVTFEKIHYEGTVNVVDAARDAAIDRFIQMSANGARADGVSRYQTTKWQAEEYVRNAGFRAWTVFRPAVIFGDPGPDSPEFVKQVATTLIAPFPVLPVFGDGQYGMQPISVDEVAAAFVQALTNDKSIGKSYCVAGKEVLPYTEALDTITRAMGHEPKFKIPQPLWLARPLVQLGDTIGLLPISIDQFEMLVEGNTCDSTRFYADFELTNTPFTPENLAYVKAYV